MKYRGRTLDAISLWSQWVDLPPGTDEHGFSPLVRCPNPNHPTEKRHFQVNFDRPLVHCFANCGISGTYEKAIGLIEGISEPQARKLILKRTTVSKRTSGDNRGSGSHKPLPRGHRATDAASIVKLDYGRVIPQIGTDYLHGRRFTGATIAQWRLGWDQDERRIVIPADDRRGITRFLIKRAVRERDYPKYLYWPEKEDCGWGKQDILFGACQIDQDVVRSTGLILCEGSLDCIKLHQHGYRNAVAILGSYLSERQLEILSSLRPQAIYFMFDKDAAGYRAMSKALSMLVKYPAFVCLYPKGKGDPADLSGEEVRKSIDNALSVVEFNRRLPKRLKLNRKAVTNA